MKMIIAGKSLALVATALALGLGAGCNRKPEAHEEQGQKAKGGHAEHKEEHGHKAEGSQQEEGGHAEHAEHGEEKVLKLDEAEMKEFGIEVGTAGPGKLRLEARLPGEIAPHADRIAHVVPRFVGIVREVRKQIGDSVAKGEVLAIIDSNDSLTAYEVKSLLDGTVVERHLVVGELIKEGVNAFVIADLSSVWVNLSIYQKDLSKIRTGQKVVVAGGHGEALSAHPIAEARGEISYVAPMVNEKTRTGQARVVLPNPDGRWRPGLFVTARVTVEELDVPLLLPKTALQTVEEKPCVFVQTTEGFEPRHVTLDRSNETHVEITSGLTAGERYVVRGAFTLKAELSKAAFGAGHGH